MRNNLLELLDPVLKKTNDLLGEVLLVSNLRRSTQSSAGHSKAILSIQNNRNRSLGMLRITRNRQKEIDVKLDISGISNTHEITRKLTEYARTISEK